MSPIGTDDFWEDLLNFNEQGKVIPVIGKHTVTFGEHNEQLYPWLAVELVNRLEVNTARLTARFSLNDVARGPSGNAKADLSPKETNLLFTREYIPCALVAAALHEQDFLCFTLKKCVSSDMLDREIGMVVGLEIRDAPKLFTYVRYNAELSCEGLDALGLPEIDLA